MSRCFSDYSGYFCRSWGSKEVQGKTDKSANIYMLCMLPATTTEGSIIGSVPENFKCSRAYTNLLNALLHAHCLARTFAPLASYQL